MAKRQANNHSGEEPQLPNPDEMTFEQAIAELEAINQRIEQGEVSLEQSLAAYRRGVQLSKRCTSILETAEQEIRKIKPEKSNESP